MTISCRRLVWLLPCLLLAAISCQRASYSFQPSPTSAAGPVLRPPYQPGEQAEAPFPRLARLPARVTPGVALRQLRRQLSPVSSRGVGTRAAATPALVSRLAAPYRRASAASRAAASARKEKPFITLMITAIIVVLAAIGILMILTVGSGWAIGGGILLVLAATLLLFFYKMLTH